MSGIDWHDRAGRIWPKLTAAALDGTMPKCGELAAVIPTSPRAVGRALDPIQDHCRERGLPPLTWIVVNWQGRAGSGVDAEDEAELLVGRERVFSYDWDEEPNPFLGPAKPDAAEGAAGRLGDFPSRLRVIHPPSREDLEDACEKFDRDWGVAVETLYQLCRESPDDFSRQRTTGKFILINRAYNARLEAPIRPLPGSRATELIGDFLETHGENVHEIVAAIPGGEELTPEVLQVVVGQHGKLTKLLAKYLTNGASMRSFASKFLHFHRPLVPIYDTQCAEALKGWVDGDVHVPHREAVDHAYDEFCTRFLVLYEDCLSRGLPVTVRKLDALLWQLPVGTHRPRPRRGA